MPRSLVMVAVSIALTTTGCSLAGAGGGDPVHATPPSGAYNCPSDDGTAAELYFRQPDHAEAELVDVRLAGCKGINAPGRGGRELTGRFSHHLAVIAPLPWRDGLQ